MKKLIEKYLGEAEETEKECSICGRKPSKKYPGFRAWLCNSCYNKVKREKLIQGKASKYGDKK